MNVYIQTVPQSLDGAYKNIYTVYNKYIRYICYILSRDAKGSCCLLLFVWGAAAKSISPVSKLNKLLRFMLREDC